MRKILLLFFLLQMALLLSAQQTIDGSLSHDGLSRSYILYVPEIYDRETPVPLLFNFHGYTSNANAQMWYGDFRAIADTANFIIVHPQGTRFNNEPHWNVGGWTNGSTTDDVGFTAALIDEIAANYNIDVNRVYSTGMSNGGYMSFLLACQLSDRIAAIASVTGSMTPETFNSCDPKHPMPILQIHGTSDAVVPYLGAIWTKPIQEVLDYWVDFNNCDDNPEAMALPNVSTLDGSTVSSFIYENGDKQVTTEHLKVIGGGHTWAGTNIPGAGTNYDIDASLEVWKFVSRYNLADLMEETTNLSEVSKPTSISNLYPNPVATTIFIERETAQPVPYELFNSSGKSLKTGTIAGKHSTLDLSYFQKGLYFLQIENHPYRILKME